MTNVLTTIFRIEDFTEKIASRDWGKDRER